MQMWKRISYRKRESERERGQEQSGLSVSHVLCHLFTSVNKYRQTELSSLWLPLALAPLPSVLSSTLLNRPSHVTVFWAMFMGTLCPTLFKDEVSPEQTDQDEPLHFTEFK
uniref:Uncharacterized protein n=1 Tax=Anguilla anguilla TaxID=7936 RepID=A0A0E9XKD3_ANGAN